MSSHINYHLTRSFWERIDERSKNEKFLVVKGTALFRFEHVVTGERYELTVSAEEARVVETVPGWSHDVTNTGDDELLVMLWANEVFDRDAPDTIAKPL